MESSPESITRVQQSIPEPVPAGGTPGNVDSKLQYYIYDQTDEADLMYPLYFEEVIYKQGDQEQIEPDEG